MLHVCHTGRQTCRVDAKKNSHSCCEKECNRNLPASRTSRILAGLPTYLPIRQALVIHPREYLPFLQTAPVMSEVRPARQGRQLHPEAYLTSHSLFAKGAALEDTDDLIQSSAKQPGRCDSEPANGRCS